MINRRNILAAAVVLAPTLAAAQPINVDPEGDVAHAAASARNQFNVRGAGIKVCVISYNDNGVDQAKGVYLPSSVDTVGGLHGPSAAAKDGEGAAMLEIVHRLAPDATLAFASGSPTPGADSDPAIENAFTQLANANCKIIVDDLTNTYEAPFQDGRVAKVVNQVAAKGILVVSSSGNFGNDARQTSQVWEGDFTASGAVWPGTQDLLHTFQLADGIAGRSNVVYPTDPASNDPLLACPPGQLPSGAYVPTAVAILT
jgi:hypothetical protein